MPKDLNYPCIPDEKKGEILFDWDEDHIHEYRHYGKPWFIRIQRVKENAATALVTFYDLFSNAAIPIPRNVRIRDECTEKEIPPYQYGDCFRISPFSNFRMLINCCVPFLLIEKQTPPYFSVITPAADVAFNFIRKTKAQDKKHWESGTSSTKTPEEEEAENQRKLAMLMAEPQWDTLEETFPAKEPLPTIRPHPDKKPESIFNF